jgi:hypothetical protein
LSSKLIPRINSLFVSVVLTACVSAPVQEMSDARQAIRFARQAGAEQYAPYELATAQQLLDAAEARLDKRAYGDARRLAEDARNAAIRARSAATRRSGG